MFTTLCSWESLRFNCSHKSKRQQHNKQTNKQWHVNNNTFKVLTYHSCSFFKGTQNNFSCYFYRAAVCINTDLLTCNNHTWHITDWGAGIKVKTTMAPAELRWIILLWKVDCRWLKGNVLGGTVPFKKSLGGFPESLCLFDWWRCVCQDRYELSGLSTGSWISDGAPNPVICALGAIVRLHFYTDISY